MTTLEGQAYITVLLDEDDVPYYAVSIDDAGVNEAILRAMGAGGDVLDETVDDSETLKEAEEKINAGPRHRLRVTVELIEDIPA